MNRDMVQDLMDNLERKGVLYRTGEYRDGEPVYVGAEHSGLPTEQWYDPELKRVVTRIAIGYGNSEVTA